MVTNRIKEFRVKAGMTQNELAEKLNVKRSVISKYETGQISPSLETMDKIAKALNISVNDLLPNAVIIKKSFNPKRDAIQKKFDNFDYAAKSQRFNELVELMREDEKNGIPYESKKDEANELRSQLNDYLEYKKESFMDSPTMMRLVKLFMEASEDELETATKVVEALLNKGDSDE